MGNDQPVYQGDLNLKQVQSVDMSAKGPKKGNKLTQNLNLMQNQKSLERIITYNQNANTQYKTSRLPLSNQKIEQGIQEVFLSQP